MLLTATSGGSTGRVTVPAPGSDMPRWTITDAPVGGWAARRSLFGPAERETSSEPYRPES